MGKGSRKILMVMLTFLLSASIFSIFWLQIPKASAQPGSLTGVIYDEGVDTDVNGAFDYLKIGVEVDVTEPGVYYVETYGLLDASYNYIDVWNSTKTYLDTGIQVVNLTLDGPTIYLSGFNPTNVSDVSLYDEYYGYLDSFFGASLSREYFYYEFDVPSAMLTSSISDQGIDTDGDGTFDYLEVGVQVNVTASGMFRVEVSGLLNSMYNYISVWGENFTYLDVGVQMVYLSLDGPTIYGSGLNPFYVSSISLYDENYNQLDYLYYAPLSREYSYTEFDLPPAFFTGNIYDGGVDTDGDGTFDYLRVGVEVNVTTPGKFEVTVSSLRDSMYNFISVVDVNSTYLDAGVHIVYLFLDGPRIRASGFNPAYVSFIDLYEEPYGYIDSLYDVLLSREYSYTEFDLPPAFLTGKVYDRGVDTDGDGLFNYLEVGVEVNATEAGDYEVSVFGLLDINGTRHISVWDSETAHLDVGVHVIYVSLYGPTIYVSGVNPANVSHIELSGEGYYPLGSLHNAPLSKEYSYTEFDAPFTDMEVKFIVYPDGRVIMAGTLNYTDMAPQYTGPVTRGAMAFDLTSASMNSTFIVPPEVLSEIPFDSMDLSLSSTGSDDVFDTEIICSVSLSEIIASQFPFNITDFTATGQYENNLLNGTVTIHMLPGFALSDLDVDFEGNRTDFSLSGSITVIYGTYYDFKLNETSLEGLIQLINSTIPGQGPDSLYNMTYGSLECTMLNITVTPYDTIGATIDFEVAIHGDFVQALAHLISPPYYPPETFELVYSALNATYSSVESASFELAYAHIPKEASMRLRLVADLGKLVEGLMPLLNETAPPEITQLVQSLLETRYCSVKSLDLSFSYDDGEGDLEVFVTIEGDLNAEVNHIIKNVFVNYYAAQMPLQWQMLFINETEIDVSNFRISFNLKETSLEGDVSGLTVLPPIDSINATYFKLERFFNLTADTPFPGQNEKLKVTVEGGSNATHTVRIFRPETVPEPDISALGGMTWNNQSISNLKDLIFQIGPRDNTPPEIGTPTHEPETPNPGEDVTVSVNVADADTGVRPDGVILSYSTDGGGTWNNVTMTKTTGDTYEGIIPGLPAGTQVNYIIIAYDYENNEAVKDNAGNYYVYIVIPEFPALLYILVTLLVITLSLFALTMTRTRTIRTTNFFSKAILAFSNVVNYSVLPKTLWTLPRCHFW